MTLPDNSPSTNGGTTPTIPVLGRLKEQYLQFQARLTLPSKTLTQRLTNIYKQRLTNVYKQIYTVLNKCKFVVQSQRPNNCKTQRITEFSVRLCLLATAEAKLTNMSWVRKTQMLYWAGKSPQPCTKSFRQLGKRGLGVWLSPEKSTWIGPQG